MPSEPPISTDSTSRPPRGTSDNLDVVLVYNLTRTHARLAPVIDAALREQKLTSAQFNTLVALRDADPEGLLMSAIGERLVVTKSNVTGLIDRLAKQGLVERGEHVDRRATVVRLTDEGRAMIDSVIPHYAKLASELAGDLTYEDKRALVELLNKMRRILRRRQSD